MKLVTVLPLLVTATAALQGVAQAQQSALQQIELNDSPEVLAGCPRIYAALGDSYAAGLYSGQPQPNCTQPWGQNNCTTWTCARNYGAFGYQLWQQVQMPKFIFNACSGASTDDITSQQVRWLDSDIEVVSLTAGGDNDDIFADIVEACCYGDGDCQHYINKAFQLVDTLGQIMPPLWTAIKKKAPKAAIYHLGYAEFWPRANYNSDNCQSYWLQVSQETAHQINNVIATFNVVLGLLAKANNVTFVNVDSAFNGHRMCESDIWFIWDTIFEDSSHYYGGVFHPNLKGQAAYNLGLRNALGCKTSAQDEIDEYDSIKHEL